MSCCIRSLKDFTKEVADQDWLLRSLWKLIEKLVEGPGKW
jgi:hypothetical protein